MKRFGQPRDGETPTPPAAPIAASAPAPRLNGKSITANGTGPDDRPADGVIPAKEMVVHPNGQVRQAGATTLDGAEVAAWKARCEHSLYHFAKGILGRGYLEQSLHLPVCNWLQRIPPYRKQLLYPREHCKTSIVSHALPIHITIQPADGNIYLPTNIAVQRPGSDMRILLACENADRAKKNHAVIQSVYERNELFRAFWGNDICWENPRREAMRRSDVRWNDSELILQRPNHYAEPTIQAIGIGGAITGGRFDAVIKDDLVTFEAANSVTVMEFAIDWHKSSRSLFEADYTLEFIIGTKWAVHDLYHFVEQNDPSVERRRRAVVEGGKPIYPTKFSLDVSPGKQSIEQLRRELGSLFYLNYMNTASDSELVDFDPADARYARITPDGTLVYDEDAYDAEPHATVDETGHAGGSNADTPDPAQPPRDPLYGRPLNKDTYDLMREREAYIKGMRVRAS